MFEDTSQLITNKSSLIFLKKPKHPAVPRGFVSEYI